MENHSVKQASKTKADTLRVDPHVATDAYPQAIPEAQGDLADRANVEIDQENLENIERARLYVDPKREHYKKGI